MQAHRQTLNSWAEGVDQLPNGRRLTRRVAFDAPHPDPWSNTQRVLLRTIAELSCEPFRSCFELLNLLWLFGALAIRPYLVQKLH
jgi:hypothetical protein